jgi:hypothetical protein
MVMRYCLAPGERKQKHDQLLLRLHCKRLVFQGISTVFGTSALLGAIGVGIFVCRQAVAWFETGEWPPYPVWQMLWDVGISAPASQWVGIQAMINWALESPAVASLVVLCIIVFILSTIAAYFVDEAEFQISAKKRKERELD